jgi:hypothetical protein
MRDADARADIPPNPSCRGLLAGSTAAALIAGTAVVTAVAAPTASVSDWPYDAWRGGDDHLLRLSIIASGSEPPIRGRALVLVADEALRLAALEPIDPEQPDAELIRLCDRLVAIQAAETAIYAKMDGSDDDALDAALDPFTAEWRAIEARLYEVGGPITPQGMVAMARASLAYASKEPDGSFDTTYLGDWLAINVAAFVARART